MSLAITVKLFANLRDKREKETSFEYYKGLTPLCVIENLGILPEDVAIIMINGRRADGLCPLAENDVLALFPPLGGG